MKKWQVGIDSMACITGKVVMNVLYLSVRCNLTSNLHNILKTPVIITLSLETTGILPSNMSTSSFAYSLNSSARVVSSTFFLISASTKKKPIISYFVYFKTIYQTNFSNIIDMFN